MDVHEVSSIPRDGSMIITDGDVDFEKDLGMQPSPSPEKNHFLRSESPLLNAKKNGEATRMNSVQVNLVPNNQKLSTSSNLLEAPNSQRKQKKVVSAASGSRIAEEDQLAISAANSNDRSSTQPVYTRAVDAMRKNKVELRQ